jgi:predicted nucleotidyltransferase
MSPRELIAQRRDDILRIAARRGVRSVRVFGSVARGDSDDESDIDFLVDLDPGHRLMDLGGFLEELRELLGRSVDVVTERNLRTELPERVLGEAICL